ncbi:MAG: hypothetical protein RBU23_03465 [Candidatus Auribacterota bacterium]|jgi:hypothetical protein|nr:hypothetical protein [Candidatus Auribacterota bacterium]
MPKQTTVIIRSIFLIFVMSYLLIVPSFAAVFIDFQDKTVGAVITNQYTPQGVEFNSGVVDQDDMGGLFLRVMDTDNPYMELIFANPIYIFSAKVYEMSVGYGAPPEFQPEPEPDDDPLTPPDGDGPQTSDPGSDLPPTDETKPDESIFPTIYFLDNSIVELEVIHALGEWKEFSFQTTVPVKKLSLLGHYAEGSDPIYFLIDDISFSTPAPVPEPNAVFFFLYGLYWLAKRRKK